MAATAKKDKLIMPAIQRAAIIITSIGLENAASIFKGLTEDEMEELTTAISDIQSIAIEDRCTVLKEFAEEMRNGAGGEEMVTLQLLLEKTVGKDKADAILFRIQAAKDGRYFEFLNQMDPRQVASTLQSERPQTLALILCHLNPKRAAEILGALEADIQSQVVCCIGRMDRIAPEVVAKVDAVIRKKLSGVQSKLRTTGGPKTIAEVLNHVDRSTEKRIFEQLQTKDTALVDDVKRLMLLFEDVQHFSDKTIQTLLREVDTADLGLALKGGVPELKEVIFRNLSKRAAERLAEEIELMGPKPKADVEAAQQRIVAVVRRLEEEGKISLGSRGGGGDEMVA